MKEKKEIDEEKKKEIERLLEEIKNGAPDVTRPEIEELEQILESVLKEEKKSFPKRIFEGTLSFIIHFGIMYFLCLLAFGFLYSMLTLENKLLIFFVAGVVSFILTLFEEIPRNPFRKHFISINIMILLLIIIGFIWVDRDFYPVFDFDITWLFYVLIVEVMYYLCEFFVIRKLRK